jgi:hypothetical protein
MSSTATAPAPASPPQPTRPATSPPRHRSTRHVVSIVLGSVVGLLAFACVVGGALTLVANGEKEDDGFLWTSTERVATSTSALTTENLDVDFDGAGSLVDSGALGKIRLKAASRTDAGVFVGIARTSDVSRYLRGTSHAIVTDVDTETFRTSFKVNSRIVPGARPSGEPWKQDFWVASSYGTGQRDFSWKVKDGDWSLVLMNADGTRGVNAAVSAGAEAPFLAPLGWSLLGGGLVLLLVAGGLMAIGVRGSARKSTEAAPSVGLL